jgi:hypothetical protein
MRDSHALPWIDSPNRTLEMLNIFLHISSISDYGWSLQARMHRVRLSVGSEREWKLHGAWDHLFGSDMLFRFRWDVFLCSLLGRILETISLSFPD